MVEDQITQPPKPSKENDYINNVVVGGPVLAELLNYLNTQPRGAVNNLCMALEVSPTVKVFIEQVDKHYEQT